MPNKGFTLLEVVVALSIVALATALVAPASFRMIASWQEASDVHAVLTRVATLPMAARHAGRSLQLDQNSSKEQLQQWLELPEGWSLRFNQPLVVHASGACEAAEVELTTPRQVIPLQIHSPFCLPERR